MVGDGSNAFRPFGKTAPQWLLWLLFAGLLAHTAPAAQHHLFSQWQDVLSGLRGDDQLPHTICRLRGGESCTPSRIRPPARVYGGRARSGSILSESETKGLMSAPQHGGGQRYPRSYGKEIHLQDATLPMSVKSGATPWKGPTTPHYIHAKPTPTGLHLEPDSEQQFGEVVTVEPTKRHTASVIWLHGLGDTGHTWSAVASWLQMSWCRFIFPTAPSQPVSVKFGYAMPSWFDFNSLDVENIDEDAATMQRSVAYLHSLIEREIGAGVRPDRILLAGFAQGGVVALTAALQCKYRLGGVLALSSWLPRSQFQGAGSVSAGAEEVPLWFHHGTEDRVVRQELGWESYQRARQLGLQAHFKLYEGLGHEYGSQEMVDVQKFLFRRIPGDAAAPTAPEPPLSALRRGARGVPKLRQGAPRGVTVGGVAAHFNAPWHYAASTGLLKGEGLNLSWKDCPGGTERLARMLDAGELDMAVLSTDGAVAEIAQGGKFRIVGPFVASKLTYGVFVSGNGGVRSARDLEGGRFAISRRGSLSHLMTYLHTTQSAWDPRQWDRTKERLVEAGNLAGAREALRSGKAEGVLWEVGAAKTLVESGELRQVGECTPPWPSFVVAAANGMLESEGGAEAVREVLRGMQSACRRFQRWPGRVNMLCHRYNLKAEDARGRLAETTWSCENVIPEETLDEVAFNLVAVGLLNTFPNTEDMFASVADVSASTHEEEGGGGHDTPVDERMGEEQRRRSEPRGTATVRFQEVEESEEEEEEEEEESALQKNRIKFRRATPHPGARARQEAGGHSGGARGGGRGMREEEGAGGRAVGGGGRDVSKRKGTPHPHGRGRREEYEVESSRGDGEEEEEEEDEEEEEGEEVGGGGRREGGERVRFGAATVAGGAVEESEPSSASRRRIRNRKCTPHPFLGKGRDTLQAAAVDAEEEEEEENDGNAVLELRGNPVGVADSSSSSSSTEESYEPEFKKTDEGTIEVTGATAHLVGGALEGHTMRGAWVKHRAGGGGSSRPAPGAAASEVNEDEQISAILERSALLSTATKSKTPHTARPQLRSLGQWGRRDDDDDGRGRDGHDGGDSVSDRMRSGPASDRGRDPEVSVRGWESRGLNSEARRDTDYADTRPTDASARSETRAGHALDDTWSGGRGERSVGGWRGHDEDWGGRGAQEQPPGGVGEGEGQEFVTSSHDGASSLSSTTKASRAALHLRKLRDSVASIRRTAAKAQRPSHDDSSASSIQPLSLFSERKKPPRPDDLDQIALEADRSSPHQHTAIHPSLQQHHEDASFRERHGALSGIEEHAAAGGSARHRNPRLALQPAAGLGLLDSRSLDSGTREDASAENHAAELRHTLRKSVHKMHRARSHSLAPTSLFGGTQPPAAAASLPDNCPICLEPLAALGRDAGASSPPQHVTRCAHRFHAACYERYHWSAPMSSRDLCPVCRTSQLPSAHPHLPDPDAPDSPADSPRSDPPPRPNNVHPGHAADHAAGHVASHVASLPRRAISPLHLPSHTPRSPGPGASLGLEWVGRPREPEFASSLVQPNPVFAQSPGLATPWVGGCSSVGVPGDGRSLSVAAGDADARMQHSTGGAEGGDAWDRGNAIGGGGGRGGLERGVHRRAGGWLGALREGVEVGEESLAAAVDGFGLPAQLQAPGGQRAVPRPGGGGGREARGGGQGVVQQQQQSREGEALGLRDPGELEREIRGMVAKENARSPSPHAAQPAAAPAPRHLDMLARQRRDGARGGREGGAGGESGRMLGDAQRKGGGPGSGVSQRRSRGGEEGSSSPRAGEGEEEVLTATHSLSRVVDTEWRQGGEVAVTVGGPGERRVELRCSGVREAVAEVNKGGGAMRFMGGPHAWTGDATVRRGGVNATAEEGVTLRGQWLFKDGSAGAFEGTRHRHRSPHGSEPCILVWGGPWLLDACDVRSVRGVALMCADSAALMLRRCGIGGRHGADRSSTALSVGGSSRCLAEECVMEHAGTDLGGGAGVRAMERGRCSLERSTVQHCSYCIAVHGSSRVIVRASTLRHARFSALYADMGSSAGTLLLQRSTVAAPLWYTAERVGRFESTECSLPPNSDQV